jgi:hypothetical protein
MAAANREYSPLAVHRIRYGVDVRGAGAIPIGPLSTRARKNDRIPTVFVLPATSGPDDLTVFAWAWILGHDRSTQAVPCSGRHRVPMKRRQLADHAPLPLDDTVCGLNLNVVSSRLPRVG